MGTMKAVGFLVVLLALVTSPTAEGENGIPAHKVLSTRVKIQSGDFTLAPPGVGPTPLFPANRRRLAEDGQATELDSTQYNVLQNDLIVIEGLVFQFYGNLLDKLYFQLPTEFVDRIRPLFNSTASAGRSLLADGPPHLTFYSTWKQSVTKGVAEGIFIFNEESTEFLDIVTASGTTYTFQRGVLLLPDDQVGGHSPSYATSVTGFTPASPSKPTLVRLSSRGPTDVVPNVAIRFDYTTPLNGGYTFSLYFTTLGFTSPLQGLELSNLNMEALPLSIPGLFDSAKAQLQSKG